jgi:protein-L-isoaspartate(D-aspartate) O-methyltransferase
MDPNQQRIEAHRIFFARLITASAGIAPGSALESALASTPRERFVGPLPWKVYTPVGYIEIPSNDPAFLYQDIVVSLGTEAPLNNGQPVLHAYCLAALAAKTGEGVVHIGAGTGYYTALLAKLVGDTGRVDAYEIDTDLAPRASLNLAEFPQVTMHARSGSAGPLPDCDAIYVNAGASAPLDLWLDALRPMGRLLFPLAPAEGVGAMLLIKKKEDGTFSAEFLVQARFVPCLGAQDEATAQRLVQAFRNSDWSKVRSLHRGQAAEHESAPGGSCWFQGQGWWLSTR